MRVEKTMTETLTRLPHIDYFKQTAGKIMKQEMKAPVILSLDISNFKYFNQMYGYDAGDKLIERCVCRYCHMNSDCVLAGRVYVDHIIMLIEMGHRDVNDLEIEYDTLNRQFGDEVNQEFPLARVRMYMGAYVVEDLDDDINNMIDKAQYARRSIKTDYSKTIAMFTTDMAMRASQQASVLPMFFSALESGRIKVYIQPKFSIDEQKLIGGEALSRIVDADGNIVSPSVYIDMLENTGLISRLDNYVIMKVIELQKEWMNNGYELTTISMNLSKMDFWKTGFIRRIDDAIRMSGVPAKYFEFELTETIFCENLTEITRQIDFLRERGYKISMDDFGSGYNSLYMLGKIPVDIIKFDRGFVLNSLSVDSGRKIMKNLMNNFKDIQFEVICEGIESREEERIVHECGCNAVQGYLHDKPLPYEVFEDKYMKTRSCEPHSARSCCSC